MAVKREFSSFEDLISQAKTPVLVDFYAEWCGPCRMMGKILDQVKSILKSRLEVVKIDSERYPAIASQYHVQALPTLLLFHHGTVVEHWEGVQPPEVIIERVRHLV
ncbi:thioredoxin [Candidatus Synechococcus calcipolaris G9]|uniref:Thioredoxin n=1 Tax=Candidatus Synechococcus calcipolaris G9 TaxID=1497997 RepID=A0ABT6F1C5_9SYNE|nr:thioredoxin [Candidatus Synechococcus calcipolaris]MDG2991659.1 thioredoxin [Candidatus Synechococcus calcipolaris G9]